MITMLAVCGCAGKKSITDTADEGRLRIVCTTFPQYDWTANLIRGNEEKISLIFLADKGGDLHNFQPSALDIARVAECDLFIYVGGESDGWAADALKEALNPDMRVINMMKVVSRSLVAEEHIESMGEEHVHAEHAYDEHVWLSLRNAALIAEDIAAALTALDSKNAALYEKNLENYRRQLQALDGRFAAAVADGRMDTLLFADRFPFRYLVEDYGLDYYAAFDGCSAETEASFETVAFLVNRLDELALGCVFIIDGSDDRLARVIIENTQEKDQRIFVLDSMQSVSKKDAAAGMDYLTVMGENCRILELALAIK